jgi:hypothetical protein
LTTEFIKDEPPTTRPRGVYIERSCRGIFICAKLIPIQPTLSEHAKNAYGHMNEKFFIKRSGLKQQN